MIGSIATLTADRYEVADISTPLFVAEHAIGWYRPEVTADLLGFVKPFPVDVSTNKMNFFIIWLEKI